MPHAARRVVLASAAALALGGCAIRYDATGVSRVGVFLWGLGDPPGVKWDLDWPRREVPELPATAPREAPPNGTAPQRSLRSDNSDRACRRAPDPAPAPVPARAGDRRGDERG